MRAAIVASSTLLLGLAGCGPGAPGSQGPHPVSEAVAVRIEPGGGLTIEIDGRATLALAPGAAPTARTFLEDWSGPLAIHEFQRSGEQSVALDRVAGVEVSTGSVRVRYRSADGARRGALTVAARSATTTGLRFELEGEADSLALPFRCDEDGSFHGFGERYDRADQRGEAFTLVVGEQGIGRAGGMRIFAGDRHTTYFPMPYWVDARGFGVLVETAHRVEVDLCASDPAVAWVEVVSGEPFELVLLHGPTPLDVVRGLGEVVGRPARPPSWAFTGAWIAAQGGRDAVLAAADRLEAAQIPATAIWAQDWTGTRRNIDGGFGVQYRWAEDPELYPDLAGMIGELRARGLRFLGYANPFVDPALDDHFPEMDARGLLVRDPRTGGSYLFAAPNGEAAHPDTTSAEAREYVKAALRRMVDELGMDGWMVDFGEWLPLDARLADGSDPAAYHNLYPTEWQRLTREVLEEARPDGDWVMFARSGWTGVQGVAQIHWAGDQEASWSATDGLPTVVPALLTLGLAGQPFVTHDVAGFSGGPSTRELFLRWTELGAFTPILRTHEGNLRLDNWSWDRDEETTAHFRRFARVHAALAPELERLADEAAATGAPVLRHLLLAFPDDPVARGVDDAFMLGEELLVAPVVHEGATSRPVYLPDGAWYHVWTGELHAGPATVEVPAPLGSPPVFSLGRDRADLRAIE